MAIFYTIGVEGNFVMKKKLRIAFYILGQCTWGGLQTLVGGIMFLRYLHHPHKWYHGAVVTDWHRQAGLSLGMFLFVAQDDGKGQEGSLQQSTKKLLAHEYGHGIQSLLLGPLYLPLIGLPSAIWCNSPYWVRMRKERKISYYAFFPERWADRLGKFLLK